MHEPCRQNFDQALLSGYLDGELRQFDEQLVRNHLEDCAACRAAHAELAEMRETALSTRFRLPQDKQWSEAPRTGMSRGALSVGWIMVSTWAAILCTFTLWQIWQSPTHLAEKLLVFGGLTGFTLLFLSALIDRLAVAKTDPYREVQK